MKGNKKSIADDIELMKKRRDDRKQKNIDDKGKNIENGKACDQDYELLMKKKKKNFVVNPEDVFLLIKV